MKCDRYEVLQRVVRIANRTAVDPQRGFKAILRYLAHTLELSDAAFWLVDSRQKSFTEEVTASGTALFHPFHRLISFDAEAAAAVASRRALVAGRRAWFPLADSRSFYGLLVLTVPAEQTISAELVACLAPVCEQLAIQARLLHCTRDEKERNLAIGQLQALSAENDRKVQELSLLYRVSRALHSTVRLNELVHLILSAVTLPDEGGFDRAMLFTINERSGVLLGMLGVTRETAALVLPVERDRNAWQRPVTTAAALQSQRETPFSRQVMKQRLPLDAEANALARAAVDGGVVLVNDPAAEPPAGAAFAETMQLGAYACVPLSGRDRSLGVLVVDNSFSREELTPGRLRFLQLFANQAGSAMENSLLVHRLETAHRDLQETQERLIQGEKLAVLGEMAASVAHELKNPLVSVGGFAQRLARLAVAGSREQEYGAIIARESRRMEEMLANILAFSKKQLLCFGPCQLRRIIEEALDLEADTLRRAHIEVVTELEEGLPAIAGDEQKLRQVILNFITNARQVMSHGGTLTLRAYRTTLRGDTAVGVEVEDTGGGIPIVVMRNIFNPFFTTKEEGTGLGLSISHRIIELHRGEITVENLEKGARFTLILPVHGQPLPFR